LAPGSEPRLSSPGSRDARGYSEDPGKSTLAGLLTRPAGIKTIVSLNPIMVDGTGMCGGCRVSVGEETRFACVDGPEFDGHQVDFSELADRLTAYRPQEQQALERSQHECRMGGPQPRS